MRWQFKTLSMHVLIVYPLGGKLKKSLSEALEPRLAHSCRNLSQVLWHEAARSISTPPGRDASPSQVTPQQFVRFSPTICRYPFILLGGERGTVRVKCLAQ